MPKITDRETVGFVAGLAARAVLTYLLLTLVVFPVLGFLLIWVVLF